VFFILSKTLNYFTMLMVLICGIFLLSVILRNAKWKKRTFWIAFGFLFFFSNDFIANEVMMAWEIEATPFQNIKRRYELGIVLTGVTSGFREPADRVYFQKGADRVTHAVQLYKEGYIKKILISGGSGKLVDVVIREADELKKAFLLMGVPEADLLIENQSRNTYESAIEVK
jgi:vancomycin permeability regulator SanA